jgi:hypothetical protein
MTYNVLVELIVEVVPARPDLLSTNLKLFKGCTGNFQLLVESYTLFIFLVSRLGDPLIDRNSLGYDAGLRPVSDAPRSLPYT